MYLFSQCLFFPSAGDTSCTAPLPQQQEETLRYKSFESVPSKTNKIHRSKTTPNNSIRYSTHVFVILGVAHKQTLQFAECSSREQKDKFVRAVVENSVQRLLQTVSSWWNQPNNASCTGAILELCAVANTVCSAFESSALALIQIAALLSRDRN